MLRALALSQLSEGLGCKAAEDSVAVDGPMCAGRLWLVAHQPRRTISVREDTEC